MSGDRPFERGDFGRPIRVEGGLVARSERGSIGSTWWSRRFVAVLESLSMGGRLTRGRTYARKGQVLELRVRPGVVLDLLLAVPASGRTLVVATHDPAVAARCDRRLRLHDGRGILEG